MPTATAPITAILPYSATAPPPILYAGDSQIPFQVQFWLDDNSGPLDLTGASVSVTIVPQSTQAVGIYGDPCSVSDAPNGMAAYQLSHPLALPAGVGSATFQVQFTADYGNGRQVSADPFPVTVLRRAGY